MRPAIDGHRLVSNHVSPGPVDPEGGGHRIGKAYHVLAASADNVAGRPFTELDPAFHGEGLQSLRLGQAGHIRPAFVSVAVQGPGELPRRGHRLLHLPRLPARHRILHLSASHVVEVEEADGILVRLERLAQVHRLGTCRDVPDPRTIAANATILIPHMCIFLLLSAAVSPSRCRLLYHHSFSPGTDRAGSLSSTFPTAGVRALPLPQRSFHGTFAMAFISVRASIFG